MLSPSEGRTVVRVLDFGVAKVIDDEPISDGEATQTRGAAHAFSRAYAAPEQLAGGRTGPWTDIHALGLLLTELLTDHAPYASSDPTELYELVFHTERPSPAQYGFDVGPWQAIIERAVSLKPSRRFPSVAAFAVALEQTIDQATLAFRSGVPRTHRLTRPRAASAISTDTTRSEVTASSTFSVASSEEPIVTGAKPRAGRSRRTISGLAAVAAFAAGSFVAWNVVRAARGVRDTSSAGESPLASTAASSSPATSPSAAIEIESPAETPLADPPQPERAQTKRVVIGSPRKKARPPAPSASSELPSYVVE
jgi:serine/threonine protein kinase